MQIQFAKRKKTFSFKFVIGSRINVLTAHAQTLSSHKWPNGVARLKWPHL